MRIPINPFQRQVAPSLAGGPALTQRPPDTGMGQLGEAVTNFGMQRHQVQELFQHEQDKVAASQASSQAQLDWLQKLDAAKKTFDPGSSVGFVQPLLDGFDKDTQSRVDTVQSPGARQMLAQQMSMLRSSIGAHSVAFETDARRDWRKGSIDEILNKRASSAVLDPSRFNDLLAQQTADVANSIDLSPVEKQAKLARGREVLAYSAGQTVMHNDPAGFLKAASDEKLFNATPFMPHLSPQHLIDLKNHAQVLMAQRASKAEADNAKFLKEAETTTDTVRKMWVAGEAPSLSFTNEVLGKTVTSPYEGQIRYMLQQMQDGAGHGSLPLPKQEQNIREAEASAGAHGTSADATKLLAYAREVTNTQRAAYADNPWAASSRFARAPLVEDTPLPAPELVPEYVKKVAPMMDAVESLYGKPVSPLQPRQVQKFSEQLAALPPGPRADILGRIGDPLNLDRIHALVEQLDKTNKPLALMLRAGSGKTTFDRAASETLARGVDALRDKTIKPDDAAVTGWRAEIATKLRGTLGSEKDEQDMIDAVFYTRAGMEEPGYPGGASIDAAIRLAVGQHVNRGGIKTILPKGMTTDDLADKLRTFTPEVLRGIVQPAGAAGAGRGDAPVVYFQGQPRTLDQLSSALQSIGLRRNPNVPGTYVPVTANGSFVTLDAAGTQPLNIPLQ